MRTIVYAPFYFALSGGYFARAGLAVELITSPDPSRTGHMLLEHAADVSWGGPMRVLQHHQADAACELDLLRAGRGGAIHSYLSDTGRTRRSASKICHDAACRGGM